MKPWIVSGLLGAMMATAVFAGQITGTAQSSRLYTAPDPSASGGIHARVAAPDKPASDVFAVSQQDYLKVYRGTLSEKGREIAFNGLPVGKYDLLVVYPDEFYEGMVLSREPDTLTEKDRQSIQKTIESSVPFFDTKKIHRSSGTTGKEGKSRCVLQEVRTRPVTLQDGSVRPDIQVRSLKLALVEDVGTVGWQLGKTREIIRQEVGPKDVKGVLPHRYAEALGGIRVTDAVKDLGELRLK